MRAMRLSETLRGIAGDNLLQETPYPVIAPDREEMLPQILGAARSESFRILLLGTGSSFPGDFSLVRDNVIAITTSKLAGMKAISTGTSRVFAGTSVAQLIKNANSTRKTVGGLLAWSLNPTSDVALKALWPRLVSLRVLTGKGETKEFFFPSAVSSDDPGLGTLYLGSRGRMGMIVSIDFLSPLPVDVKDGGQLDKPKEFREVQQVLRRDEAEALFDPEGLFKW